MSDQCMNCTVRGDLKECLSTDCSQHESWMTQEVMKQLQASQDEVSRLKSYVYEIAEIALMEGADEFGYSWEDFKAYRIESDLEELNNNQASETKGEG